MAIVKKVVTRKKVEEPVVVESQVEEVSQEIIEEIVEDQTMAPEETVEVVEETVTTKEVVAKPVTKTVAKTAVKKVAPKKLVMAEEASPFNFTRSEMETAFALALEEEIGVTTKVRAKKIINILEEVIETNAIAKGKSFSLLNRNMNRKIINGRAMPCGPVNNKDNHETYKYPTVTLKMNIDALGGGSVKGSYDKEAGKFTTLDGTVIDIQATNDKFEAENKKAKA